MLFNSYMFIFLYLPVVLFVFFWLGKANEKRAAVWLTLASLFFYGWWNVNYLFLLMTSIVMNFQFSKGIEAKRSAPHASYLLTAAITSNLLLLCLFKYADFFIDIVNLTGSNFSYFQILLPLGISFFTFTQIAYLVDVYKGIAHERNFIHYVLFVTWFPHLIAGPVLHHQQMMPQFAKKSTYVMNPASLAIGLSYFILGLFKKVVIADQFAMYANPLFDGVAQGAVPLFFEAWIGALAYTLQLYFDFSGYSDMAIGLSKLFNIDLPINFNAPYKAANIIEFWRRWHMTLSQFLRDYLYIPLGGNKKGTVRRYLNLFITMLLGGLWHGAGWKFLLWGALHGMYLIINHFWHFLRGNTKQSKKSYTHAASVLLTFMLVVIAWVPFKADNLNHCLDIWYSMSGLNGISLPAYLSNITSAIPFASHLFIYQGVSSGIIQHCGYAVSCILLGLLVIWGLPNTQQLFCLYPPFKAENMSSVLSWEAKTYQALILGTLLAFAILNIAKQSPFLYFQF